MANGDAGLPRDNGGPQHVKRADFTYTLSALVACTLAGCGSQPKVQMDDWGIARKADDSGYSVKLQGKASGKGAFSATLQYLDHNGCTATQDLESFYPLGEEIPVSKVYEVPTKAKIQRAKLVVEFTPDEDGQLQFDQRRDMFTNERTVDPLPPGKKPGPCPKAKKTPESSLGQSSREENAATMINMAGYLCGRVLEAYSIGGGKIVVRCTEYRDGRGRVKYEIDTDAATVQPMD